MYVPEHQGVLRSFMLHVPECIQQCSGLKVFGRTIRSLVFTTDAAIIANCNADAVIAVYPFTPHPMIVDSVKKAAAMPVFAGVGGGRTQGKRVIDLAKDAEFQGSYGIVVNAPTQNDVVKKLIETVDIPVVVTVVSEHEDIAARVEAGVKIVNVSAAGKTPQLVSKLRADYPELGIIATGGPTEESIQQTISAGANAITWTPPTSAEVFKSIMEDYRHGKSHP